jgi:SH3 domain protein
MWLIIATLCGLLLFPAVGLGKSLYVKDKSEALLRTGPSLSNKILVILKPGQEVSLVKEEGDYYVVSTPNGTQGYVLKYLLTDQSSTAARGVTPPQEPELQTQQRNQDPEQQTQQRIQDLETRAQEQEKELIALREERDRLAEAKKQAEGVASQQAELVSQLQAQQRGAQSQDSIRWFLSGAGVLLTGMLLGWFWGSRGRRSNLRFSRF